MPAFGILQCEQALFLRCPGAEENLREAASAASD